MSRATPRTRLDAAPEAGPRAAWCTSGVRTPRWWLEWRWRSRCSRARCLVGRSVRSSLRALALERVGRTEVAVVGARLFDESLAERLASSKRATGAVLVPSGVVREPASGRRGAPVESGRGRALLGLPGQDAPGARSARRPPEPRRSRKSSGRARAPCSLPAERGGAGSPAAPFRRGATPGPALRLRVAGARGAAALGEFSLRPRQDAARVLFVPLAAAQAAFGRPGRVNLLLCRGPDAGPSRSWLARRRSRSRPAAARDPAG